MALLAVYQYRRGEAFTVKYGWRSRKEHPTTFWWGVISTGVIALMFAIPGLVALLQP
jgi:hypothetical protein